MANFKYTAIAQNGKQKTGSIEAPNKDEANAKLSAMGLMPTQIAQTSASTPTKAGASKSKGEKKPGIALGKVIKSEDLCTFTRQLATLLEAGLPLLRALEVMIRQERNLRFKVVLEKIA